MSSLSFYPITSQHEFSNRKTQFYQGRTKWCQQITVQEHIFVELALVHLNFCPCTSPTDTFPLIYHPFNGPGICVVYNVQHFIFDNSQSPDKFTKKPKRKTITTKPPIGRIIRQQKVGYEGMKMGLAEEIGIGAIVLRPLYGPKPLEIRPMSFTTLLTCTYLILGPKRARNLWQWRPIMSTAIIIQL